jgi:hypothetical protein
LHFKIKMNYFFIFLLISSFVNAQLKLSVKNYYKSVNDAENFIIQNDFKTAIKHYNKAFDFKEPFCKDTYNQAVCYAILNKSRKCLKNINILLKYGYPIDSILSNEKLKNIAQHNKFKEKPIYDFSFRKTMDSLLEKDQFFRRLDRITYKDSIRKIDSTNVLKLLKLIDKKGFPSERNIGVYSNFDYQPISIIIVHNSIIGFNFSKIVLDAINNGDLDNRIGADLHNLSVANGGDLYGTFTSGLVKYAFCKGRDIIKSTEFGFIRIKTELVKNNNINRVLIGLDDIETNQKKLLFGEKHKYFKLSKYRDKKILCYENENDYNNAKTSLLTN